MLLPSGSPICCPSVSERIAGIIVSFGVEVLRLCLLLGAKNVTGELFCKSLQEATVFRIFPSCSTIKFAKRTETLRPNTADTKGHLHAGL